MYFIFTFSCHQHQWVLSLSPHACPPIHLSYPSINLSTHSSIVNNIATLTLYEIQISVHNGVGWYTLARHFLHVPWNFRIFHDELGPDGTFGGVDTQCHEVDDNKQMTLHDKILYVLMLADWRCCHSLNVFFAIGTLGPNHLSWLDLYRSLSISLPVYYLSFCINITTLKANILTNCHILTTYCMCSCQPSGLMSTANSVSIYWGIIHNANEY